MVTQKETVHDKFVNKIKDEAKKAHRPLGPCAQAATQRPSNYVELEPSEQWAVDKGLGILDWEGTWDT